MMNSINLIFMSFFMAWILFDTNTLCEATKRSTSYRSSHDDSHNILAMDATNEQQQYLTAANPTILSDARIPAGYAESISYHDIPPVNYPILATAAPSLPKYCAQPLYAAQLNSGQNIYRAYDIPTTTYDRMALPIVQSAPIANLYMPPPPPPSLVKSANDPYGLPLQPITADAFTSNAFNY